MWFRNFMLLFLIIAVAEFYVLIEVGGALGAGMTIFLIILTGVIGVNLLKQQGFEVVNRLQAKMAQGQAPAQEMVEGILLIISGAFLITPGFITDLLGFLTVIAPIRGFFARSLIAMGWFKMSAGQASPFGQQEPNNNPQGGAFKQSKPPVEDDGVIEGEFERKD